MTAIQGDNRGWVTSYLWIVIVTGVTRQSLINIKHVCKWQIGENCTPLNIGGGYFKVKTLPSQSFSAILWPQGRTAKILTWLYFDPHNSRSRSDIFREYLENKLIIGVSKNKWFKSWNCLHLNVMTQILQHPLPPLSHLVTKSWTSSPLNVWRHLWMAP